MLAQGQNEVTVTLHFLKTWYVTTACRSSCNTQDADQILTRALLEGQAVSGMAVRRRQGLRVTPLLL